MRQRCIIILLNTPLSYLLNFLVMPKFNIYQIISRLIQIFLILLISFTLLNVIIFSLQIIYPAHSWKKLCSENICSETEHSIITNADIIYRYTIQKIFYILFLFFLALAHLMRKKKFSKYIILLLSIQSLLFAYFATRGRQWYFEFGTETTKQNYFFAHCCWVSNVQLLVV